MAPDLICTGIAIRPAARHLMVRVGVRFGSLVLKTLFVIGISFTRLIRAVIFLITCVFCLFLRVCTSIGGLQFPTSSNPETEDSKLKGFPEGWVRIRICQTDEISELDLEACSGCRQVLSTEIEMRWEDREAFVVTRDEILRRVVPWLEDIERLGRGGDSGYSSPEAEAEGKKVIFWGSPNT